MDMTPAPGEHMFAHSYVAGTPVFDANGEKVGVVGVPETQGNYLVVEKGWLFTYELYIPFTAIHAQDTNGIYLNLTRDELQDDQWKVPPGGGTAIESTLPPPVPADPPDQESNFLKGGILPGPVHVDPLSNG